MSILRWGCIPKFIDIEDKTFSNPDLVEKEITSRTKAIMVTNLPTSCTFKKIERNC